MGFYMSPELREIGDVTKTAWKQVPNGRLVFIQHFSSIDQSTVHFDSVTIRIRQLLYHVQGILIPWTALNEKYS